MRNSYVSRQSNGHIKKSVCTKWCGFTLLHVKYCTVQYVQSLNQPSVHCTIDNIAPSYWFRFGKVSIYPIQFVLLCHDIRDVMKRCTCALHVGRYCTTKWGMWLNRAGLICAVENRADLLCAVTNRAGLICDVQTVPVYSVLSQTVPV